MVLRASYYEIYGSIVVAMSIMFIDSRLKEYEKVQKSIRNSFEDIEKIGQMAYNTYRNPS